MWALALMDEVRHDYGGGNPPIAICGHKGSGKIDYNAVTVPKCQACLLLWPKYGKKKETQRLNSAKVGGGESVRFDPATITLVERCQSRPTHLCPDCFKGRLIPFYHF